MAIEMAAKLIISAGTGCSAAYRTSIAKWMAGNAKSEDWEEPNVILQSIQCI